MSYLHPADRSQLVMMNSLDDLVASDHPVHIIDALIDAIVRDNPKQFPHVPDGDVGRPEYAPSTMLKLYLYGYLNGIRSSRKLESETKRNIELLWLLGTLSPDHWTISQYRKTHQDDISFVSKKFREFLRDKGYIKGERVAIDGTKMKANARREMFSLEKIERRLQEADEKVQEYLDLLAANDAHEEETEDEEDRRRGNGGNEGDPLSKDEQDLTREIAALQTRIEELKHQKTVLETTGRKTVSRTDPEAPLMRTRDGKMPAYNIQMVVDDTCKLIASTTVMTDVEDHRALPEALRGLKSQLGIAPKEVLADKGYYTPDAIERVETEHDTICYIPVPDQKAQPLQSASFTYDEKRDCYLCSEGKRLPLLSRDKQKHNSVANVYRGTECQECRLKPACTSSVYGRMVHRYHNHRWREKYKQRMESPAARRLVAVRKTLVEHPFGWIKCVGGKIPLLLRGIINVRTEINLYTAAYNLRRLFTLEPIAQFFNLIKSYRWTMAT